MARRTNKEKRPPRRKRERTGVRRLSRHLENVKYIHMDDYDLLQRLLTEHGKIVPARLTGASAKQQRRVKKAVRRARVMGILP
jgi:small subunit ribosomal protein S18